MTKRIHLIFAANDAYAMPLAVAAHSALRFLSKKYEAEIYVFDGGISPQNRLRIEDTLKKVHPGLVLHWPKLDLTSLSSVNVGRYSKASLARLIAPHTLDDSIERALYLDSDLIVERDISELWEMDISGAAVWAVQNGPDEEFDMAIRKKFFPDRSTEQGRYMNSGVLLFNLPEWKKSEITSRTLKFLQSHQDLSFPDQDALNATLYGEWGALPRKWNKQTIRVGQPESAPLSEDGITHYTSHKPWQPSFTWPGKWRYQRAYIQSRWEPAPWSWFTSARLLTRQIFSHNVHRAKRKIFKVR